MLYLFCIAVILLLMVVMAMLDALQAAMARIEALVKQQAGAWEDEEYGSRY